MTRLGVQSFGNLLGIPGESLPGICCPLKEKLQSSSIWPPKARHVFDQKILEQNFRGDSFGCLKFTYIASETWFSCKHVVVVLKRHSLIDHRYSYP
jgi:hypothetical protein